MERARGQITITEVNDGKNGTSVTVVSTSVTYQLSSSGTVVPTGTWQNSVLQTTTALPYLWTRTVVNYSNGKSTVSYSVSSKGDRGIQGPAGKDGKTTYFHVKYSAKEKPTAASDMTETPSTYIGTYTDYTEADSSDPSKYTWCRFQGAQGPKGDKGIPGTNGTNGKTQYLHIKYSNDGKTFTAATSTLAAGETAGSYIGQYVDFTEADSTEFSRYTWSKIKGETGQKGDKGEKGDQGTKGDKGDKGDKGTSVTVKSTATSYQISGNAVTVPSGTWSSSIVAATDAQPYLWTRTQVTYSDGTVTTSYSVGYRGKNGTNGKTPTISISTDGYWVINGTKTSDKAEGDDGHNPYIGTDGLWYTWDDKTNAFTSTGIKAKGDKGDKGTKGDKGDKGADGTSVTITGISTQYQISNSGTTVPTGTWSNSILAATDAQPFLWTRTTVTYSTAQQSVSYSVGYKGKNGSKGDKGDKGSDGQPALTLECSPEAVVWNENGTVTVSADGTASDTTSWPTVDITAQVKAGNTVQSAWNIGCSVITGKYSFTISNGNEITLSSPTGDWTNGLLRITASKSGFTSLQKDIPIARNALATWQKNVINGTVTATSKRTQQQLTSKGLTGTNYESRLQQSENGLKTRVTTDTYNSDKTKMEGRISTIEQTANNISLKVGSMATGKNMWINGAFDMAEDIRPWIWTNDSNYSLGIDGDDYPLGFDHRVQFTVSNVGSGIYFKIGDYVGGHKAQSALKLQKGQGYCLSFWARTAGITSLKAWIGIESIYMQYPVITDKWARYSIYFDNTLDITNAQTVLFYTAQPASGLLLLTGIQFEQGTKEKGAPSVWSRSQAEFGETGIDITTGKITVMANNFVVKSNSGVETAAVDAQGNLTAGSLTCKDNVSGTVMSVMNGFFSALKGKAGIRLGLDGDGYPCLMGVDPDGNVLWSLGQTYKTQDLNTEVTFSVKSIEAYAKMNSSAIGEGVVLTLTVKNGTNTAITINSSNISGIASSDSGRYKLLVSGSTDIAVGDSADITLTGTHVTKIASGTVFYHSPVGQTVLVEVTYQGDLRLSDSASYTSGGVLSQSSSGVWSYSIPKRVQSS